MPDQATPELPRIALVFGDETAVVHVREAMHGLADIVYAASAADFDAKRMSGANAAAALVNLDDGDWLEAIEARLDAIGVAVVFNDPEISCGLDGWERARWLRHLLAKLRGSADVDPPRPEQAAPPFTVTEPEPPASAGNAVVERPLSPQEIETMTADFVAEQETASVRAAEVSIPSDVAVDCDGVGALATPAATADAAPEPVRQIAAVVDASPDYADAAPVAEPVVADPDGDGALDVDTETLSAMIDARLAQTASQTPSDSPEVWRVVEGGAVSPVHLDRTGSTRSGVAPTAAAEPSEQQRIETAAQDDADVLAGLPSLGDWQLVDPDAAPAPAAASERKRVEPSLPDSFAGLELMPMEMMSAVEIHTDPIERWLHDGEPGKQKKKADNTVKAGANGGNA